jgi:hypothetical protein
MAKKSATFTIRYFVGNRKVTVTIHSDGEVSITIEPI